MKMYVTQTFISVYFPIQKYAQYRENIVLAINDTRIYILTEMWADDWVQKIWAYIRRSVDSVNWDPQAGYI
jgi:hypothetical protein